MTKPVVSIVLPTYNGSKYLRDAIDSCLSQTYDNWELVVVDDASTDDTPVIIGDYVRRDSRIRVLRNVINRRLPASLNAGFNLTRGRYLTWTSDDNQYRPTALQELVDVLDHQPVVDIAYTRYRFIDDDGKPLDLGWSGPIEGLPFGNVVGACFLYRRQVHERLRGYQEDLFLAEDYDFWLRASVHFAFRFLDKDLYEYRRHGESLSVTRTRQVRVVHERCLERNLPEMRWMNRALSRKAYQNLVTLAVLRRDRPAAWKHLLFAFRHHPSVPLRQGFDTYALLLIPRNFDNLLKWLTLYRWNRRRRRAVVEIEAAVPPRHEFALLDEATLGTLSVPARPAVPFVERDGTYFGLPADDQAAIDELERLRRRGVSHFVIAWPAFWCLEHYRRFHDYLELRYRCLARTKQIMVFDLTVPCADE